MTDLKSGEYYAEGDTVRKAPNVTKTEGGSKISVGFPVLTVTDCIGIDGIQFIVDALNIHEHGCRVSTPAAIRAALAEQE